MGHPVKLTDDRICISKAGPILGEIKTLEELGLP
jgi:hypothetical protein